MILRNIGDQEELSHKWKHDPFRMSVVDFQRASLDKLAEILAIFITFVEKEREDIKQAIDTAIKEAKEKGDKHDKKEKMEDVSWLLQTIKTKCSSVLPNMRNLTGDCSELILARNIVAHEAYIKIDSSKPKYPRQSKSTSSDDKLMRGRTF